MYPEDSIMCCLFPNSCNMFPRTLLMTFLDTSGLTSNPWQSTWLYVYMIIFIICLLKYVGKLIVHNDSSEENCIQELLLQKEEIMECIDNNFVSDENNSECNEVMAVSRVGQGEPEPVGCPVNALKNKPIPCESEEISSYYTFKKCQPCSNHRCRNRPLRSLWSPKTRPAHLSHRRHKRRPKMTKHLIPAITSESKINYC
eukprot:XP_003240476.1 PREDICTED: uncharacterized protein LOC100575679 isoform X2 [Acyrthosiphon pisum]